MVALGAGGMKAVSLEGGPEGRQAFQKLADDNQAAADEFLETNKAKTGIVVLEALIEYIRTKGDVWFGTHADAVRWVREQAGMD